MRNITFLTFIENDNLNVLNDILLKKEKLNIKFEQKDMLQLFNIIKGGVSVKTLREYIKTIINSKCSYFTDKNDLTETIAKFILDWYDDLNY